VPEMTQTVQTVRRYEHDMACPGHCEIHTTS
jgi:hypothetical protein